MTTTATLDPKQEIERSDRIVMTFQTKGDWYARDLEQFLEVIETLYDLAAWRDTTNNSLTRSYAVKMDRFPEGRKTLLRELYIHKISMASDGLISFRGGGPIIRQVRALIRDLLYGLILDFIRSKDEIEHERKLNMLELRRVEQEIRMLSAQADEARATARWSEFVVAKTKETFNFEQAKTMLKRRAEDEEELVRQLRRVENDEAFVLAEASKKAAVFCDMVVDGKISADPEILNVDPKAEEFGVE